MKIQYRKIFYVENDRKISVERIFHNGIHFYADIEILSNKLVEYQKQMISDFFTEVGDKLESEDWDNFWFFKKRFEDILQDFNSKLFVFVEKAKDVERIWLKWIIQVVYNWVYMCSMIWETSVLVFRNWNLSYSIENDVDYSSKIDCFSEFVEWELENADQIVSIWLILSDVVDKDEVNEILQVSDEEERDFIDFFEELITLRIPKEQIWFITLAKVSIDIFRRDEVVKKQASFNFDFSYINDYLLKFRYPIIISFLVVIIIVFLYYFFSNYSNDSNIWWWTWDSRKVIDFTLDDLNKQFVTFKQIPEDSDEKIKVYEEIQEKIDLLDQKWMWPNELPVLREALNTEYYRWFKILLLNRLENEILEFNSEESEVLWNPFSIRKIKWLINISWNDWAIVWIASDKIRWSKVEYNLPYDMVWCSENVSEDWLMCYSENWDLFNVTKSMQSIVSASSEFPSKIDWVWTFWTNKIYLLREWNSMDDTRSMIVRYVQVPWKPNHFENATNYTVDSTFYENNQDVFSWWFSDLNIDYSFLVWAKSTKALYQFRRENSNTTKMTWRKINISWWIERLWSWFSENVKIFTEQWSRYVYIYDKEKNFISMYWSTPYKTNSSYYYDYGLRYMFSIKISDDIDIKDIDIEFWEKHLMYVLTDKWVYLVRLQDIFDTFVN